MKRIISACMALVLMLSLCCTAFAAAYTNAQITVTYGQTEGRTVLDKINAFRTGGNAWCWNADNTKKVNYGVLSALRYDYNLEKAAMQRAAEIAISFSHTRPDGSTCFTVCDEYGANPGGENIAIGYRSANEVHTGFLEENEGYSGQGHRRNMLEGFACVGIGHAVYNGVHCWVEEFGWSESGAAQTAPVDTAQTRTVRLEDSGVKRVSLGFDAASISLSAGENAELPAIYADISYRDSFLSSVRVRLADTGTVKSANPGVAKVENGRVYGISAGTTTLTCSAFSGTASITVTVKSALAGDVNGDGSVNSSDALMVLRHTVNLIQLEKSAMSVADLDGNGQINSADALRILQISVGL
ncbi:MAG: hypothetical protein IJT03_01820 [Clostridia bacterium]|nr:hypothetical protein [Clostridia bacterium]